ncbi:DUF2892 domain-containing protein [Alkalihalobacterium elongatum]|uniref:DUF2892 domain-containing protein n=1 Tax=Alkalihalobacterium elongatum TaxID=2675466 RepID=UPI001C1F6DC3|nr:DUF2892 domain-containing protein [Alkalihalobacterium elongatum]
MALLPATTARVPMNTMKEINQKIAETTRLSIEKYNHKNKEDILKRIMELDQEWDTERILETSAASFMLMGTILGITKNRSWHLFSGVIGYYLLRHALQGWCPPLPVIRKLGVRTASEIQKERNALLGILEKKNLRSSL